MGKLSECDSVHRHLNGESRNTMVEVFEVTQWSYNTINYSREIQDGMRRSFYLFLLVEERKRFYREKMSR